MAGVMGFLLDWDEGESSWLIAELGEGGIVC